MLLPFMNTHFLNLVGALILTCFGWGTGVEGGEQVTEQEEYRTSKKFVLILQMFLHLLITFCICMSVSNVGFIAYISFWLIYFKSFMKKIII